MNDARRPGDWLQRFSGRVLPSENPMFTAFKEYEEVPDTLPLDFTDDVITWFTSNLSGATGALGAEVIEVIN